jgi:hypothetical protein
MADTMDLRPPEPTRSALESAETISIDAAVLGAPPVEGRSAESSPPIPAEVAQPAARGAAARLDDNRHGRVDRLRKASSVVLDQAAFDPSLRFLLVTVAIFILFVVLLVLSKVIG